MRFEEDIIFVIRKDLISDINKSVEKAHPNEACGFIFGNIQEINNKGNFKSVINYRESMKTLKTAIIGCGKVADIHASALENIEESMWDRIYAVNVKGVFLTMKCAIPVM